MLAKIAVFFAETLVSFKRVWRVKLALNCGTGFVQKKSDREGETHHRASNQGRRADDVSAIISATGLSKYHKYASSNI